MLFTQKIFKFNVSNINMEVDLLFLNTDDAVLMKPLRESPRHLRQKPQLFVIQL